MSGTKISKNNKFLKSNSYGYIYILKNGVNGKVYIGKVESPRTPNDRWVWHCKQASKVKEARELFPNETVYGTHLQNAILKYGKDSFEWNYLDKAKNLEELNEKEKHWIKEYDSMNREKGYNLTSGGDLGTIFREEVIEKMSENMIQRWQNQEIREMYTKTIGEGMKKMWQSKEWREGEGYKRWIVNNSEARKKNWKNLTYAEKVSKGHRKEIDDKYQFLKDIKAKMFIRDLAEIYGMTRFTINIRIREILGKFGVKNYTEAKKFLQDKSIRDLLKEIENKEDTKK